MQIYQFNSILNSQIIIWHLYKQRPRPRSLLFLLIKQPSHQNLHKFLARHVRSPCSLTWRGMQIILCYGLRKFYFMI
jgi:hypothetical protein